MLGATVALVSVSMSFSSAVMGMDGRVHHPIEEAHGKPAVFVFISHDCPICNSYSPEFDRLAASFRGQIVFDLVYAEPDASPQQAREHAKEFALEKVPWLLDPARTFAAACGAGITPQAVVFDQSGSRVWTGRIDDRYVRIGIQRDAPTTHDLREAIDAVIRHQKPKPAAGGPVGCYILKPGNS